MVIFTGASVEEAIQNGYPTNESTYYRCFA